MDEIFYEFYYFDKSDRIKIALLFNGDDLEDAYDVAIDHMDVDDSFSYFVVIFDDEVVLINTEIDLNRTIMVYNIEQYREEGEFIKVKKK